MALGRLHRKCRCADRGRAAPGAEEPARRTRQPMRSPRLYACVRPRRRFRRPKAGVRQASENERVARQAWRDAQHRVGEARDALARAEKAAGELSSRRAALEEARARVAESHAEAEAAFVDAEGQFAGAPDLGDLQSRLDRMSGDVARDRAALADARAAHEGLKREAEARTRRLEAIATERKSWIARAENADRQIASLAERRSGGCARAGNAGRCARRDRCAAPGAAVAAFGSRSTAQGRRRTGCRRRRTRRPRWTRPRPLRSRRLRSPARARVRAEERLTAADERRKRSRGAHPGSAEHAAASGHPPDRARSRRPHAGHGRGRAPA